MIHLVALLPRVFPRNETRIRKFTGKKRLRLGRKSIWKTEGVGWSDQRNATCEIGVRSFDSSKPRICSVPFPLFLSVLKMENFRKRVEFFPSVVTNRNSIIEEGSFISFLFVIHSIAIKDGNNQKTLFVKKI